MAMVILYRYLTKKSDLVKFLSPGIDTSYEVVLKQYIQYIDIKLLSIELYICSLFILLFYYIINIV